MPKLLGKSVIAEKCGQSNDSIQQTISKEIIMKLLYEEDSLLVTIKWSKPIIYENLIENGSYNDDSAHLYMITGKYLNNSPKLYYVGKTYDQYVSHRLTQVDHKNRYDELYNKYPKHKLFVSHGTIEIEGGNRTRKRVDEIERILIYSMNSDHTINKKNLYSHGVTEQYLVSNKGYKSHLPSTIGIGVFIG